MQVKIDTRYLEGMQEVKFRSRWRKLSHWYETVLKAFKSKLPYDPTIFVTPFYVHIASRVAAGTMFLRLVGLTSIDPDEPHKKWAIYIPYSLIKHASKDINIANLAHEIAHFNLRARGIRPVTANEILRAVEEAKSPVETYEMKEGEVKDLDDMFEEPVRSMIANMKKEQAKHPSVVRDYLVEARGISQGEFYYRILGPARAKEFLEKKIQDMTDRP
jgi:hypothetical protein